MDEHGLLRGLLPSSRCPPVSSRMVPIVLEVTCSFVTWLCLYGCFCRWNKQRSFKWSCRLVTLLHGLIVTCLSGYVVFLDGLWPLTHAGMCRISPVLTCGSVTGGGRG